MKERSQRFDPRQNMRLSSFEVFHYRDAAPSSVEVHHHDFYEVYFFLSGQVEYRVEGQIYNMEPGDLLLISPMELHQAIVQPGEPYERIVLWIDKQHLAGLSTGETSLTRCFDRTQPTHSNLLRLSASQRTEVTARLGSLVREYYGGEYGSALSSQGILLQFLVELNRLAFHAAGPQPTQAAPSLVERVLRYIGDHYNEALSLEGLAQQFFVSKYYLSHEFSRTVGTSVYRYIMLKRLLIAKQMLSGGVAPGDVYSHCGFSDYSGFYRAFKAEYGISPRACQSGGTP